MKSIPCEQDKTVFSGYTMTHEHDFITTHLRDDFNSNESTIVACLTCDATYCNVCGKPLKNRPNYQRADGIRTQTFIQN
jgi:hypothetical protein